MIRVDRYTRLPGARCHCLPGFLVLLLALLAISPAGAQNIVERDLPGYGLVEYMEGEVLIRFRDHVPPDRQAQIGEQLSRGAGGSLDARQAVQRLEIAQGSVEGILQQYRDHPDIASIQPNLVYRLDDPGADVGSPSTSPQQDSGGLFPNDPHFFLQWALHNEGQNYHPSNTTWQGSRGADISAPLAWQETTGSDGVIIAIFDTGIDYNHPDLSANIFRDSQGRAGVNCSPGHISVSSQCSDDVMDRHGHGTHVAGIIGASGGNGVGIAGVNWNTQLMAIKIFSDEDTTTTTQSILLGMQYAIEQGATISNHSYGGGNPDPALFAEFTRAREEGHLVITAAGNQSQNNDTTPFYPASYDLDNIISVASTNSSDNLWDRSNYGSESVHIAAPGYRIWSTNLGGGYSYKNGTSMAAPHVAGVAGLVRSIHPNATYQEIRDRILINADALPSLEGRIAGGRRLNALHAVSSAYIQFTHASVAPEASDGVDILVNGVPVRENLHLYETSEWITVSPGSDLEITVVPAGLAPELEGAVQPLISSTWQLTLDRQYRMVISGAGGSEPEGRDPAIYRFEVDEMEVPDDRVEILFFNGVDDLAEVGLFGFFLDERPPFVITDELPFSALLSSEVTGLADFDIDVTGGPEQYGSYRYPPRNFAGSTVLAILTGLESAGGEQHMRLLYSTGEGHGTLALAGTPGTARHEPERFTLESNFPNPFYPVTQIQFTLHETRDMRIEVYDIAGRLIQVMLDETMDQGIHRLQFDGSGLSSGMYLYRVQAGRDSLTGRMMLVK